MDEIFKATFDDAEIIAKLDALEKQIQDIGATSAKTGEMVSASMRGAADATQQFDAALSSAAAETAGQAKAISQARAANQSWAQAISQTIAGQQVAGRSLGEWAAQARTFAGNIQLGAKGLQGASAAFRIFNGVLKASGIGLLIGLVASAITYFTKFQSGIDKVSQVMAGANAIFDVLIERFLKFGSAILKFFTGDFAGAAEDAVAAITGIGDAIVTAAREAYELEKAFQSLRDTVLRNSIANAQQQRDLAKVEAALSNVNLTIAQQMKLEKEAGAIRQDIAKRDFEAAKERLRLSQLDADRFEEDAAKQEEAREAQKAFLSAEVELIKATSDAENRQRELRKQASDERKKQQEEEAKRVEQLRKEYEKLFADIQQQANALEIENTFNPFERVLAQYEASKAQINQLRERLLEIAPDAAARARVENEVDRLFAQLLIKYREEYAAAAEEVEKLRKERLGDFAEAVVPIPKPDELENIVGARVKNLLANIKANADEFTDEQQPRSILEILGISEESFAALQDATAQIVDSLGEIADARLREAEAATAAAEEKVRAAEELLEREQELADEGLANSVERAEQNLETQKKLRDEALKEEAKARRAQVLLDSVGQLSSLITASANIFKSLSSIQFVGIPLAIATIGVMFAAFAKAKSDALKAATAPKLRKGGKIEGRTHEQGGEMAISDSGDPYELERGEWVIGTKHSQEHDKFLGRLNKGEFSGINLDGLFRPAASNALAEAAPRIERMEREFMEIRETQHTAALTAAYYQAAADIVRAIEEKEVVTPLTDYKVTKKRGRNTYTEIVRKEK